ncbi:hypothetical protein EJ05DRAFT_152740 [Pseudovirgaria hyperparasitica]|uniref:Uncharacterized protein n=1 Tax=Pseudovirgaria hyperparasitica TaxID=470096 RepID=A0A6A6VUF9_9PEZI|nr:uncharacterized protein EJ05DRAFT_152740 [Pseudovirgaria hyperparasitica]KAF2754212.1 hypothetical protein EJ05DRAFT_152740 [Pseudovirgaria hyperparasitica]
MVVIVSRMTVAASLPGSRGSAPGSSGKTANSIVGISRQGVPEKVIVRLCEMSDQDVYGGAPASRRSTTLAVSGVDSGLPRTPGCFWQGCTYLLRSSMMTDAHGLPVFCHIDIFSAPATVRQTRLPRSSLYS